MQQRCPGRIHRIATGYQSLSLCQGLKAQGGKEATIVLPSGIPQSGVVGQMWVSSVDLYFEKVRLVCGPPGSTHHRADSQEVAGGQVPFQALACARCPAMFFHPIIPAAPRVASVPTPILQTSNLRLREGQ